MPGKRKESKNQKSEEFDMILADRDEYWSTQDSSANSGLAQKRKRDRKTINQL